MSPAPDLTAQSVFDDTADTCHVWALLGCFALQELPPTALPRLCEQQRDWNLQRSRPGLVAAHRAWHAALGTLTGNDRLGQAIEQTLLALAPRLAEGPLVRAASVEPVLESMLAGDIAAARDELRRHVADVQRFAAQDVAPHLSLV